MKMPQRPPSFDLILKSLQGDSSRLSAVSQLMHKRVESNQYLHWDEFRRRPSPAHYSHEEYWFMMKLQRRSQFKQIALKDKTGNPFQFCVPDFVMAELHQIDIGAGGFVSAPEQITNTQTRDQYLMRSLMEEAITSSQLEGAVTTREVAKEMIRSGRSPRTIDEQMILNNFRTMQKIIELKDKPLTPDLILEMHQRITEKTLVDSTAEGRFRQVHEKRIVGDDFGEVFHEPPPAEEIGQRIHAMCEFANEESPDYFVHPVVRAIILHFWLAYDHPFVDGNGRTARALFYWAMLRKGYWLFEFISISTILKKAPIQYGRSFLYTETDDNDLTYFFVYQIHVIHRAMKELHEYIARKTTEVKELETQVRAIRLFNHRQADIIRHALRHPLCQYTIESHRKSNNIAYQTARTDLLNLHERHVLELKKSGRKMIFLVPGDIEDRLKRLEKKR